MKGVLVNLVGRGDGADFLDEAVDVGEGFFAFGVRVDFEVAFANF